MYEAWRIKLNAYNKKSMGTRHYIQIQLNNEYRLEQYGQWDGYMSGVGVDIIIFLKKLISNNLINDFVDKVSKLKSFTDEELDELEKRPDNIPQYWVGSEPISKSFYDEFPQLNRNTSSKILDLILEGKVDKVINGGSKVECDFQIRYVYVVRLFMERGDEYCVDLDVYNGANLYARFPHEMIGLMRF